MKSPAKATPKPTQSHSYGADFSNFPSVVSSPVRHEPYKSAHLNTKTGKYEVR